MSDRLAAWLRVPTVLLGLPSAVHRGAWLNAAEDSRGCRWPLCHPPEQGGGSCSLIPCNPKSCSPCTHARVGSPRFFPSNKGVFLFKHNFFLPEIPSLASSAPLVQFVHVVLSYCSEMGICLEDCFITYSWA